MRRTIISLFIILALITGSLYSANLSTDDVNFEQHRQRITKIFKAALPVTKKLYFIFKKIKNKKALWHNQSIILILKKNLYKLLIDFEKIHLSIGHHNRNKFRKWYHTLAPKYHPISIKMNEQRDRVENLPGCNVIFENIGKKIIVYLIKIGKLKKG